MLIPEDRQDEEPKILERLRRGQRVDHFETVRRRKDDHPIEISLTISPVKNQHGRSSTRPRSPATSPNAGIWLVNRELHHRVKNTLATVQAVIASTARHAQSIADSSMPSRRGSARSPKPTRCSSRRAMRSL
jgi:hypothetical protein